MEKKMRKIPNVGDVIPAFDDGKIRFSRLYEAKITRVVPFEEAKTMKLDDLPVEGPYEEYTSGWLMDIWEWNKKECDWVFADETDYFIEAEMPNEVANPNWFARTKDGGWFSMNVQSFLQGARLDTDLELYKYMITEGYGSPDWCGDGCKKEIEKYNKIFGV